MDPDLDFMERREQSAGWTLIDPRTRTFRCPIAGCVVCDMDREFHLEWHAKIA